MTGELETVPVIIVADDGTRIPLPTSKHRPYWLGPRAFAYGVQALFRFPNGRGASLIHGSGSYGYEIAVTKFFGPGDDDWELDYTTPVTDRAVLGWLRPEEIEAALDAIAALPDVASAIAPTTQKAVRS